MVSHDNDSIAYDHNLLKDLTKPPSPTKNMSMTTIVDSTEQIDPITFRSPFEPTVEETIPTANEKTRVQWKSKAMEQVLKSKEAKSSLSSKPTTVQSKLWNKTQRVDVSHSSRKKSTSRRKEPVRNSEFQPYVNMFNFKGDQQI